jgi:PhnB protein
VSDQPTFPTLCPYLYYEDLAAALDWLARAFGFRERMRNTNADGTLGHCEMEFNGAVIMMGSPPGHKNPAHLGQVTVGLYVYVDDVDEHHRRAKSAGANIESDPTDQPYGDRNYGVTDPEGHQWWFAQAMADR